MKKTCLTVAFILALGQFFSISAEAATATSTLNVSATVGAVCTVSTTAIDFGTYEGLQVNSTGGDITVTCTTGTPYNIALDAGLNLVTEWRAMSNGVDALEYALYNNSGNDGTFVEWGDSDFANTYSWGTSLADTGTGTAQPHTISAALMPSQTASSGLYTDVVQVTVHY